MEIDIIAHTGTFLRKIWSCITKKAEVTHEAKLSRKNYINKRKFDDEYAAYRELLKLASKTVEDTQKLFCEGVNYRDNNREKAKALCDNAEKAINNTRSKLLEDKAFINETVYVDLSELLDLCDEQCKMYDLFVLSNRSQEAIFNLTSTYTACFSRPQEIQDKYNVTTKNLKTYLDTLDVIK